jgi:hypothetical protein
MLPRSQRQEALSRAYVRAVAAQAGVICGTAESDFGIDLYLRAVESHGPQYWDTGAQLDVQVKSTTRAALREDDVAYDLEVRAYNLLRQEKCLRPRVLVLLVLPDDEAEWLSHSEEELSLRRCAYWTSLRGAAPTDAQTTIRITLPRANVFSAEALTRLLDEATKENPP